MAAMTSEDGLREAVHAADSLRGSGSGAGTGAGPRRHDVPR